MTIDHLSPTCHGSLAEVLDEPGWHPRRNYNSHETNNYWTCRQFLTESNLLRSADVTCIYLDSPRPLIDWRDCCARNGKARARQKEGIACPARRRHHQLRIAGKAVPQLSCPLSPVKASASLPSSHLHLLPHSSQSFQVIAQAAENVSTRARLSHRRLLRGARA